VTQLTTANSTLAFLKNPLLNMHPMLNIATRAARTAGDIIVRSMDRVDGLQVDEKSRNDYASEVDKMAEQAIIQTIRKAYPEHTILAEESGLHQGNEYTWVIDPLDGTTNFLHGFPQFAVSIALVYKGNIEQALVYDPLKQEMYTASRGRGAMLNNRRIRVTQHKMMHGALLGTGFPFKAQKHLEPYLDMFRALFKDSAGIRRAGSAALDLAYVACGRLDGFWEIGLREWDVAAGILLVQEAGGIVTDFSGAGDYLESGNIIAANSKIHALILKIIAPHVPADLR